MSENGRLPRLGSAGAPKAAAKTETIELTDRGVSIELRKPRVATIVEFQERTPDTPEGQDPDPRVIYDVTVWLIAQMLVDPDWSEEQLAPEVNEWTMSDWNHVQQQALELAGLGGEAQRAAQAEFQESKD